MYALMLSIYQPRDFIMALPPLYALRAFDMAVRYGSFRRAAEALHVTPGAISRHIKTLENWYNCQLFVRSGPKVKVSEQGFILAQKLREGFQQLETACEQFPATNQVLRLKAPSTLSMRWLLDALKQLYIENPSFKINMSSVWMDVDYVDFKLEEFDCAILLGDGSFGQNTETSLLFKEWLIPVCSPSLKEKAQRSLDECSLIHTTADKRDWKAWLDGANFISRPNLKNGITFDTLEQGINAAVEGYGVSIGDLRLVLPLIKAGKLVLPYQTAVATGHSYYFTWPHNTPHHNKIFQFSEFIMQHLPPNIPDSIVLIHEQLENKNT
jgi:LysR family transcriptional regulator, glycine cleavage system transcriptional activator